MLCLAGGNALSDFRQTQLVERLRNIEPCLVRISASYIYFVDTQSGERELETAAIEKLRSLLDAQGTTSPDHTTNQLTVVPRLGTRSAWSSKATDIVKRCGLTNIDRVERGVHYAFECIDNAALDSNGLSCLSVVLHDRMTESVIQIADDTDKLFKSFKPAPLSTVPVLEKGQEALARHSAENGLALSPDELDYLEKNFSILQRNPSDAELMMFAQANSEHCRHKIFNASWTINGESQHHSLFGMIRNTYENAPKGVLSAYHDNAAVIEGGTACRWMIDASGHYNGHEEPVHIQIKVETHNHPTAISPFPGAATGSGGEIRDEGAVGNGAKPKAGLCGFSVSNLAIPGFQQPWETVIDKPDRIASAFEIMRDGPIGAAAFNNEFGRPNLAGYFRTFCLDVTDQQANTITRGFHKPIMIAGGLGNIRKENIDKKAVPVGSAIVVLGGPSMLIGLGGGAASSVSSGDGDTDLDYASVQRGNPEMQRRCQEVIDRCIALGDDSPILSIHDVGAGGLSNALPELINDAGRGGQFELRDVLNDEPGMSPMEIWSNESQERYVMAVAKAQLPEFEAICQRERCLYAIVGETTENKQLTVNDKHFNNQPVDMPLDVLLGKPPKLSIDVTRYTPAFALFNTEAISLDEAVERVLKLPSVASKNFLITIGDRSITGQVARDQLVGPWQMPVADVAVTVADFRGYTGEAMAMGERSPIAIVNPAASARMAMGEALTNIMAADIGDISQVKLSANWMASMGTEGEEAALFDAVKATGLELAPALDIAIPVGKDSLSMKTTWQDSNGNREVVSPVTVVISAFAAVCDTRRTLTPQLRTDCGDTELLLIDLGAGKNRLGGSALAQVFGQVASDAPDVDDAERLKNLFLAIQMLIDRQQILAWHDRSDGGLFTTLAEMAFAGNVGITITLDSLPKNSLASLFNEELGGVLQIRKHQYAQVMAAFEAHQLTDYVHTLGNLNTTQTVDVHQGSELLLQRSVTDLKRLWWQTSYQMQRLRDNPESAEQELAHISRADDPGITPILTFDPNNTIIDDAPKILQGRPMIAILREQGVNGHFEMAAAFDRAGFETVDVHMSDLFEQRHNLTDFKGLAACGGFSFGDVLGAGGGWANSILFNPVLSDQFQAFFNRDDTFTLGVCNGCQMLSRLKRLIPGAMHWPEFVRNESEQFEARVATVEVYKSPSLFFTDMEGSRLPVALAHGEGKAVFASDADMKASKVSLGFVDNFGNMADSYPLNPNGSPYGITGLTSEDGRVTIMMPHPERVFRTVSNSWTPPTWNENGPWLRMFENARVWVD